MTDPVGSSSYQVDRNHGECNSQIPVVLVLMSERNHHAESTGALTSQPVVLLMVSFIGALDGTMVTPVGSNHG